MPTEGPWKVGIEGDDIVIIGKGSDVFSTPQDDIAEDDAMLIAAAPQMLEALEAVADYMWANNGMENTEEYDLVEAAILAAKGYQTT